MIGTLGFYLNDRRAWFIFILISTINVYPEMLYFWEYFEFNISPDGAAIEWKANFSSLEWHKGGHVL
jgi:hypothetical protein